MTTKIQKEAEFRTTDLYFAAYLKVVGLPMGRTERNGGKLTFVFDASVANMDELRHAWISNTGKVAPLHFANEIKSLKSLCHMP